MKKAKSRKGSVNALPFLMVSVKSPLVIALPIIIRLLRPPIFMPGKTVIRSVGTVTNGLMQMYLCIRARFSIIVPPVQVMDAGHTSTQEYQSGCKQKHVLSHCFHRISPFLWIQGSILLDGQVPKMAYQKSRS